jgi:hypothetical protein
MKHPLWENYTLEEMLSHLVVCLEWKDGYPEREEGSSLARFHNYEFEFNDEYDSFLVSRINNDNSRHIIHGFAVRMSRLIDAVIGARMRGFEFTFWDKESLEKSVLSELDLMTDILVEVTPEGKHILHKSWR